MPSFSARSRERLETCDQRLVAVFHEVVKHFDCTILEGWRSEENQNEAFRTGKSKLKYPDGNHNKQPSFAVDVVPYPVDWENLDRFRYFAGFVMGIASQMGTRLRWGGDWDGDTELRDQRFVDLPHFEVLEA